MRRAFFVIAIFIAPLVLFGCGGGGTTDGAGSSSGVTVDIADPALKAKVESALSSLDAEDRALVNNTRSIEARTPPSGDAFASNSGVTIIDPVALRRWDIGTLEGILVHEAVHHVQNHATNTRPHNELEREAYERQRETLRKLGIDTSWIDQLLSDPNCCPG